MKIYNVGIDLKRAFTDVLRGIVQNEDVMFKTVISDDGKPIDYSTCNIIMVAVRLPDYTTEKTLEAINIISANAKKGIVEFKLPKEFTEQEGVHQLQIAFFDKGNMVKTARFNYCVEDGLLLDEPSETEIITTEDLLRKVSEALVTSQEISSAESVRIAAEELRNTAEEARISNELERKDAEAFRNEKELSRGGAEADRKEAEDIRLENEAERIEAEAERLKAENAREQKIRNMNFTAITLEAGASATARTAIDEESISVEIGVPRGDKGDKGDAFAYEDFTDEQKADLLKDAVTKQETVTIGMEGMISRDDKVTIRFSDGGEENDWEEIKVSYEEVETLYRSGKNIYIDGKLDYYKGFYSTSAGSIFIKLKLDSISFVHKCAYFSSIINIPNEDEIFGKDYVLIVKFEKNKDVDAVLYKLNDMRQIKENESVSELIVTGQTEVTFDGKLEDVEVYNTSHTFNEILTAYNEGKKILLNLDITNIENTNLLLPLIAINETDGCIFAQSFSYPQKENINNFHVGWHSNDVISLLRTELASQFYVDVVIGDIETSLENIIAKYGLGGETE